MAKIRQTARKSTGGKAPIGSRFRNFDFNKPVKVHKPPKQPKPKPPKLPQPTPAELYAKEEDDGSNVSVASKELKCMARTLKDSYCLLGTVIQADYFGIR